MPGIPIYTLPTSDDDEDSSLEELLNEDDDQLTSTPDPGTPPQLGGGYRPPPTSGGGASGSDDDDDGGGPQIPIYTLPTGGTVPEVLSGSTGQPSSVSSGGGGDDDGPSYTGPPAPLQITQSSAGQPSSAPPTPGPIDYERDRPPSIQPTMPIGPTRQAPPQEQPMTRAQQAAADRLEALSGAFRDTPLGLRSRATNRELSYGQRGGPLGVTQDNRAFAGTSAQAADRNNLAQGQYIPGLREAYLQAAGVNTQSVGTQSAFAPNQSGLRPPNWVEVEELDETSGLTPQQQVVALRQTEQAEAIERGDYDPVIDEVPRSSPEREIQYNINWEHLGFNSKDEGAEWAREFHEQNGFWPWQGPDGYHQNLGRNLALWLAEAEQQLAVAEDPAEMPIPEYQPQQQQQQSGYGGWGGWGGGGFFGGFYGGGGGGGYEPYENPWRYTHQQRGI